MDGVCNTRAPNAPRHILSLTDCPTDRAPSALPVAQRALSAPRRRRSMSRSRGGYPQEHFSYLRGRFREEESRDV